MAQKLPQHVADRWGRVVDRYLYSSQQSPYSSLIHSGYYPRFPDFCKFVSDVFESMQYKATTGTRTLQTRARGRARSLATQADEKPADSKEAKKSGESSAKGPPSCTFCKGSHVVSNCTAFLEQGTDAKKTFAKKHGMCFGCL